MTRIPNSSNGEGRRKTISIYTNNNNLTLSMQVKDVSFSFFIQRKKRSLQIWGGGKPKGQQKKEGEGGKHS